MTENIESIDESLKKIYEDLEEISKKTGIKTTELLPIMANRELVIINNQLRAIHEHLDRIEDKPKPTTSKRNQTRR